MFVIAPVQIFNRVLPIIEEQNINYFTVVTTKELAPFFEKHFDCKVIVPSAHPNLITEETKRSFISNAIKAKRDYKKYFADIAGEDIYLFFTSWALVFFYFVKKLSRKNNVYLYVPEENSKIEKEEDGYVLKQERSIVFREVKDKKAKTMRMLAKKLLGVDVFILKKADRYAWELKRNSFPMRMVVTKNYAGKLSKEFLTKHYLLPEDVELSDKNVLFLSQDITSVEGAEESSVISITDYLMDILDKKYQSSYVLKGHPADNKFYGKMEQSEEKISPHILAEVVMNHKWKHIIGYYTDALNLALIYTDAKVISLLYLWDWGDKALKDAWIRKFNEVGVIMPKTRKELLEVLHD